MLLIQIQKMEVGKPLEKLGELHIRNSKNINDSGEHSYQIKYWTKNAEDKYFASVWHDKEDVFLKLIGEAINELLNQSS